MAKPKTIKVQLTTWEFAALEKALESAIEMTTIHAYSGRALRDKLNTAWLKAYPGPAWL